MVTERIILVNELKEKESLEIIKMSITSQLFTPEGTHTQPLQKMQTFIDAQGNAPY